METALAISPATYAANDLAPWLVHDFIAYIDRGAQTTRAYLGNLRQFFAWLKYKAICRPARQDVLEYKAWLAADHAAIALAPDTAEGWTYRTDKAGNQIMLKCKPATVAGYLRSVCQFFKWTAAEGLYPNIAENIHAPKMRHDVHKKDALTPGEALTIERSIADNAARKTQEVQEAYKDREGKIQRSTEQGKRLFAMYLLAVNAGLRTIELSRACVKDFILKGGQAWLMVWGKGHTEADQRKALSSEVAAAIQDYLNSRSDKPTGSSPLFCSTGNRAHGKRIAATTISTMLKRAMQAAGFNSERLTAHSLRHTAGTAAHEVTRDLYATQRYMRHSNPATTEIYLHTETDSQDAAIAQRLYDLFHNNAGGAANLEKLERLAGRLNQEQIRQLEKIAEAMA